MNQILYNKIKNNFKQEKSIKIKEFKFQFFTSLVLFFITIEVYLFNFQMRNSKDTTSKQIANNYNILRLYNNSQYYKNTINSQTGHTFNIIGMIEIPKINIYYPIISESNEELLKISPCRISGPMPNEDGNLCIAGHNYDNYKFFSKVTNLKTNDEIIIHNIDGNKLTYKIFKIYEVNSKDLSPLEVSKDIKKQVTLITCNNFNSSTRIIIKASALSK